MSIRTAFACAVIGASFATPVKSQDPMSAIDWLSESVAAPVSLPITEADITESAAVENVTVAPLDAQRPDAVGLLPTSVTGLPADLWGSGRSADIADAIRRSPAATLPALSSLRRQILLAETVPPVDANGEILLARIDKLLDIGALEDALALIERAGPDTPELFRRWFDVSLLMGVEDRACNHLKRNGAISPSYQVRIFCLARNGDWNAAALTLNTATSLGLLDEADYALVSRFLDPELFEGEDELPTPVRPTPLEFRMYEAIGESLPTRNLPRAFAHADLRSVSGWKPRIEAGERLARYGAIRDNQLLGIYSERQPAASGGVWERVRAIQQFEEALLAEDEPALADNLPLIWRELRGSGLERSFAQLFADPLADLMLEDDPSGLVFRLALLSDAYETHALAYVPPGQEAVFLQALARGEVLQVESRGPAQNAIRAGFDSVVPGGQVALMFTERRLGEAVLAAIEDVHEGTRGDLSLLTQGLRALRHAGLENTARMAALQFLLMSPAG